MIPGLYCVLIMGLIIKRREEGRKEKEMERGKEGGREGWREEIYQPHTRDFSSWGLWASLHKGIVIRTTLNIS